ncbi:unnamed protein product [Soboliphyme baturini]|uniref:TFIIS N-terminal domain-containing protein n=1 Tax=Soboliphyme baturini TaxID=241478 RepID=A0A183IEV3_9BILA|nr:unnamed protein product [Soboliphyme baturini]
MTKLGEIEKIKREIEGMVLRNALNIRRMLELLRTVSNISMDIDTLRKTRIGIAVNTVRRTYPNNKPIHDLALTCIRNWKRIVKQVERRKSDSYSEVDAKTNLVVPENDCRPIDSSLGTHHSGRKDDESASTENLKWPAEPIRVKSIELLTDALSHLNEDGSPSTENLAAISSDQNNCRNLAYEIEDEVFKLNGCTPHKKYRTHIRNLVLIFKQRRNPSLNRDLVCHKISPKAVAAMSPEQLAPDSMKELRCTFERESFRSRLISENEESRSGSFKLLASFPFLGLVDLLNVFRGIQVYCQ